MWYVAYVVAGQHVESPEFRLYRDAYLYAQTVNAFYIGQR